MLKISRSVEGKNARNPGYGDIQVLLERLLVEVVSANYRYFTQEVLVHSQSVADAQRWCWPPLLSNELQLSGLVGHALSAVCPVSLPEEPISRKQSKEDADERTAPASRSGRADFYGRYGQRSIALELKRSSMSTAGKGQFEISKKKWAAVETQAQQALVHMRSRSHEKGLYGHPVGIGLLVTRMGRVVVPGEDEAKTLSDAAAEFTDASTKLMQTLKPDFFATYRPPAEMQITEGWDETKSGVKIFPGVTFAARVRVHSRGN